MARGSVRSGRRTSPATAAITSKPCRAMNENPMACSSPSPPRGRKGVSPAPTVPGGRPSSAHAPAKIRMAKTTTLPTVTHCPPPVALRMRERV